MQADVLVEVVGRKINKTFTYHVPEKMNPLVGMRALVPFGRRNIEGFIMSVYEDKPLEYEIKDIISLVDDRAVINEEMMELGKYISQKTLAPLTLSYQTMLPRALKAKEKTHINKKYVQVLKVVKDGVFTSLKQKEVFDFVKINKEVLKSEANKI